MPGYRAFIHENDENLKHIITYYHYPQRWADNMISSDDPIKDINNWSPEIKYIDSASSNISEAIRQLPNTEGGIYMFYLKGLNIPFIENYILYIGRCRYTENQNIRKRAKEYFTDRRDLIMHMFKFWKDHLYYRYFAETNNERIDNLEVKLIRAIVPPFNDAIPENIDIITSIPAFG